MSTTLLRIDSSVRRTGSASRDLTDAFVNAFKATNATATLLHRDLIDTPPLIDETWTSANFTPEENRTEEQKATLGLSDALIGELKAADIIAIGLPVYNFGVPAGLKAWIDLVARARVTFHYTENGPEGLLKGKRAVLLVASGGTPVGSDIDFSLRYLTHILGFIGITDVTVVAADALATKPDTALADARAIAEQTGRDMAEALKSAA